MTTIAVREDAMPEVRMSSLTEWAESARQAHSVSISLAATPFVPESLRAKRTSAEQSQSDLDRITVGNITAAILTGQELGLQPMAALRSMDVIQGVPALRAITLRALVQAHGHDVWVEESTETRAIVCGRRKGSEKVQTSTWSLDRARALGLIGKDNWKKQPGAMLVARGSSELCRLIAADVIMAMPYSIEELQDGDEWAPVEATETKPVARRTAQRRSVQPVATVRAQPAPEERAADPEPDFEPSGMDEFAKPAEDVPAETGEAITDKQLKILHTLLGKNDLGDRDAGLAYINGVIGRELTTSKDLTKAEASTCIDRLSTLEADDKEPTQAVLDEIAAGK
jgi:hypothetical protein